MAVARARTTEPAAPARFPVVGVLLITLLFGSALFGVNNVMLDMAKASWNQILLIKGTFAPTLDPRQLYQAASSAKALGASGGALPDLSGDAKIQQYDNRIVQQAAQEHKLDTPTIFFKGLPGS